MEDLKQLIGAAFRWGVLGVLAIYACILVVAGVESHCLNPTGCTSPAETAHDRYEQCLINPPGWSGSGRTAGDICRPLEPKS